MKGTIRIEGTVWAARHGFEVRDRGVAWDGAWANDGSFIADGVGLASGVVGPCILSRSAGVIPVVVELLDGPPSDDDLDDYDTVVDAPLELSTGVVAIEGDSPVFENGLPIVPPFRFAVAPGSYRVRVAYADRDTARYDYADGAEHVRLSFWAADPAKVVVHKKGEGEDDPVREYRGKRTKDELVALLGSDSPSHRCLAVVALARLGEIEALAAAERDTSDAVRRTYFAALGFAGERALPLVDDETGTKDRDLRLRLAQTLRLVGGAKAKEIAAELADGSDFDMLTEAAEEVE